MTIRKKQFNVFYRELQAQYYTKFWLWMVFLKMEMMECLIQGASINKRRFIQTDRIVLATKINFNLGIFFFVANKSYSFIALGMSFFSTVFINL